MDLERKTITFVARVEFDTSSEYACAIRKIRKI